ncbi:hypothetical protein ACH5RR_041139 [Cinchona calisaya]|uniref:Uncharacterized protein n=1 Tax=Cinchona calisaya TaxID=153742 RepID=A0ABD2XXY2_9GENT
MRQSGTYLQLSTASKLYLLQDSRKVYGSFGKMLRFNFNLYPTLASSSILRAFCNLDWRTLYPEALVTHLSRVKSDHRPILVQFNLGKPSSPSKPFRLEFFWISHTSFKDLLLQAWRGPPTTLDKVVLNFSVAVKIWSHEVMKPSITYSGKRIDFSREF